MSIERGNFDAVSEQDLQELVSAQVPEGLRIEYKQETYGPSDSQKREFLKDVSAFANTQGGHLILGIRAPAGIAREVRGLGGIDADAELLRLEQLARSGLEPRIPALRMKAIPLHAGGHAVMLRVQRSWNPPHRVVAHGSNRFYVRHSAGVHEPNVEELRTLFTVASSTLDKARQLRAERLALIQSGVGQRPLVNAGRIILHIVPIASFSGAVAVDVEQVYERHAAFIPIGAAGMTPRFNYYGVINERGGDENRGYTQIFRNGVIEATKAEIVGERDGRRLIPGLSFERQFFDVYPQYINGLRDIGVPPPLITMITLEGVLGVNYIVSRNLFGDYEPPLPEELLILPECVIEDYAENVDYHRAVRPAFDALWNAIGYVRSGYFNDNGLWVGDDRR